MIALNRWAVLFWGICISFILLIFIPEDQFVIRSLSVTLIAVLCIFYYLYKRYSRGLTLQADLLIGINTLMQFLLPVLFLAPYYYSNPDMDLFSHRYGFALTSFAALLGQTMFFWGYESMKKGIYFPPVKEAMRNVKIGIILKVMLLLMVLTWFSRIILLQKGYYYQIHTSDFQFVSPYFSALSHLSNFGLLILGAFFILVFSENEKAKRNSKMKIAILFFIMEIGWYLPSGSRGKLVLTILCPIFAYILVMRKIPFKAVILILLAGIPFLSFLYEFRYVASEYSAVSEINLQKVPDTYLATFERTSKNDAGLATYNIINRFYDGMNLNHLLIHYSTDFEYEYGSTYKNILYVFVPRFIYTDKPIFTQALGRWYRLVGGGATPTTFLGESYINFSWFGIIICSYLLGILMKYYDYLFIRNSSKPFWCFLYAFGAIIIMQLPVEVFVIWVSYLLKFVVIAFLLTLLHSLGSSEMIGFTSKSTAISK